MCTATQHPQRVAAVCGAGAVLASGFGALLAFWLLGSWPTQRGLFSFRAATVGDGVALPVVAGLLLAACRDPRLAPAAHARRWAGAAAALAGVLAAGVQLLWLLDDAPATNWTLPRAHHFDAPGWWHACFFVAVSAAIGGLGVAAARRVRATRQQGGARSTELARSPWLAVLVAAGVLFAGLVAIDDAHTGGTQGSLSGALALALSTGVAVSALWHAFGAQLRAAAGNLAVGLVGSLAACVAAAAGLHASPGIAVIVVLASASFGVATAYADSRRPAWGRATSAALIYLAAASVGLRLLDGHGRAAAATMLAGAFAAVAVGGAHIRHPLRATLVALATAYALGVLLLAQWLEVVHADATRAQDAVGATVTLLDAAAITLVRERFGRFMREEQQHREWDPHAAETDPPAAPDATETWSLLVGFALPTLLALAALLAVAGPIMGIDHGAGGPPSHLIALLATGVGCAILAAVGLALGGPAPVRPEPPSDVERRVEPRRRAVLVLALACCGWVAALLAALRGPLHHPLLAAGAAAVLATLCAADFVDSPVRLQLARAGTRVWALAGAGGLAIGASAFWLLAVGLWDGPAPASALGALEACAIALLTPAALAALAGVTIARALPTASLTSQRPVLNMTLQPLMYAGVALVATVIPLFAVARLETAPVRDSGLRTLASVGFYPALLGTFVWILHNNAAHARFEATVVPAALRELARTRPELVERLNDERIRRLKIRVRYVNWLCGGLLAVALVWAAAHALAA